MTDRPVNLSVHGGRALVVDDHPSVRESVVSWLDESGVVSGADGVGTLREARECLQRAGVYAIVVLDLTLPDANGLEGLTSLRESYPDVPVLVHSGTTDVRMVHNALESGAQGYATKDCDAEELVQRVGEVLAGRMSVPAEALLAYGTLLKAPAFTDKQAEVLRLLLKGMPNKVIADRLGMAEGTVKTHLFAIYSKLDVHNRAEAIITAVKLGMMK